MHPFSVVRHLKRPGPLVVCVALALGGWKFFESEDLGRVMELSHIVPGRTPSAPPVVKQDRSGSGLQSGDERFRRNTRQRGLDLAALRAQFTHDPDVDRHLPPLLAYWRFLDAIDDFRDFHNVMPGNVRADRAQELLVQIPAQLRDQRLLPVEAVSLASALLPMAKLPDDAYHRLVDEIADALFSDEAMPSPVGDPRAELYQREASRLLPVVGQDTPVMTAREVPAAALDEQLLALRQRIYGEGVR